MRFYSFQKDLFFEYLLNSVAGIPQSVLVLGRLGMGDTGNTDNAIDLH